jgi:hypothetical protein
MRAFGKEYALAYDYLYKDKDYEKECDFIGRVFKKFSGRVETILDPGNNLFFIKMGLFKG